MFLTKISEVQLYGIQNTKNMNNFEIKKEIKKLLKDKPEENQLFYYDGRFHVSRNGDIRLITYNAINQLISYNPDLEIWHFVKHGKDETLPPILTRLKVTTITIPDAAPLTILYSILHSSCLFIL